MNSINKLGLRVALITAVIVAVVLGTWWAVRTWIASTEEAESPTLANEDIEKDSDGDGISDLVENLYQTDPAKADSDGDGMNDGAEIQAGRNPTVPEEPGAGSALPIGSSVAAQDTWTAKYLASLPDDATQDQILDKTRLEAFVNLNKGELLPTLPEGLIKTTSASGKEAVKAYLDQISPVQNTTLHAITNQEIDTAWRAAYQNNQPEAMSELVKKLHENVDVLETVAAPQELTALHTKVVAAAHALTNNAELLRDMNKDFVGGLIGAKSIEELGTVFQEIEAEVDRLDTEYGF